VRSLTRLTKGPLRPAVKTLLTADLLYNQDWFKRPANLLSDLSRSPQRVDFFSVNGFFRGFVSDRQSPPDLFWRRKGVLLTSCDYAVLYLIPNAFNNLGSIIPVTGNRCAVWNA
jgi:hypothetical protein